MTSWTVLIFSASSSDISISYSSSKAMTNSTISRESAPKSSINEASGLTFSSHVEPTVDIDHLSSDISRHRSGEKGDHLGDLFTGAKTTQRYGMQKLLTEFLRQLRRHFGFDEARGDRVDRNSPGGDFPGHRLGKSQDAG